jgi:hypothetical protein
LDFGRSAAAPGELLHLSGDAVRTSFAIGRPLVQRCQRSSATPKDIVGYARRRISRMNL